MTQARPSPASARVGANRRVFERFPLGCRVRYLTDDTRQGDGTLRDISFAGAAIEATVRPALNSPVVAYIEQGIRLVGEVVRYFRGGFAIRFAQNQRKVERIVSVVRGEAPPAAPRQEAVACHLEDGKPVIGEIETVSLVGATVKTAARPPVGTGVVLGRSAGKVVWHTNQGFVIEFDQYWEGVRRRRHLNL